MKCKKKKKTVGSNCEEISFPYKSFVFENYFQHLMMLFSSKGRTQNNFDFTWMFLDIFKEKYERPDKDSLCPVKGGRKRCSA
jgi:hypothetical protein